MVQWQILNNSHAYPFCKTTPGTQLFSIGHCTIFCQWNSLKTVAKLFSQWKSGCTWTTRYCTSLYYLGFGEYEYLGCNSPLIWCFRRRRLSGKYESECRRSWRTPRSSTEEPGDEPRTSWFGGSGLLTARALLRVRVRLRNCKVTLRRSTAETERVMGTTGGGGAVTTDGVVAIGQVSEFRVFISSIISRTTQE